MNEKLKEKATVIQSINHNFVLVKQDGIEKIIMEKGIGFGKKFGNIIPEGTEVQKVFILK